MYAPKSEREKLTRAINVRFNSDDHKLLKSICRQTSQSESDLLRRGFRLVVLELEMQNKLVRTAHQRGLTYPIVN